MPLPVRPPSPMAILDSARLYSLAPAAERSRAALGWSGLLTNDASRAAGSSSRREMDDAHAEDHSDQRPERRGTGRRPPRSAARPRARRPAPAPSRGRAACRSGRTGWRTAPARRSGAGHRAGPWRRRSTLARAMIRPDLGELRRLQLVGAELEPGLGAPALVAHGVDRQQHAGC